MLATMLSPNLQNMKIADTIFICKLVLMIYGENVNRMRIYYCQQFEKVINLYINTYMYFIGLHFFCWGVQKYMCM